MSSDVKRRRGKRSDALIRATDSSDDVRLEAAVGRVEAARLRLDDLHGAWRGYLLRISLLVLLLAVRQSQGPMSLCASDIREHNAEVDSGGEGENIGTGAAVLMAIENSLCDYAGIIQAGLLAYYLSRSDIPLGNFACWPYLASAVLVPMQVSLYFQMRHRVGCAGRGGVGEDTMFGDSDVEVADRTRQFPVSVVFHAIATVSCWFMKVGRNRSEANLEMVRKLKKQLDAEKKTAKNSGKGRK